MNIIKNFLNSVIEVIAEVRKAKAIASAQRIGR